MPLSSYLRYFGTSLGTSMVALDVLAEDTTNTVLATVTPDSDTKKLLISAVTSILSTLLLKVYEDLKKRRRAKRSIRSEIDKAFEKS